MAARVSASDEVAQAVVDAYTRPGATIKSVGRELKVGEREARRILSRAGVIRRGGRESQLDAVAAFELRRGGWTLQQIADAYGVTRQAVGYLTGKYRRPPLTTQVMNVADIVEENGKTIRQNNLERQHKIPIGTLVHVKWSEWFGDGGSMRVEARMWVLCHDRDCDGTPLYTVGSRPPSDEKDWVKPSDMSGFTSRALLARDYYRPHTGMSEESLTPVEVTEELKRGENSLTWEKR